MATILSCLAYFAQHKMFFEIHPCGMYQYFTSFYHQVVFPYMNISLLVYLFTRCWTLSFQFGGIINKDIKGICVCHYMAT